MDVEQISQTKEQCIISQDNCEDAYILKDYRAGRECSTDSIDDMRGGSRALAQLHNILEKYPLPSDTHWWSARIFLYTRSYSAMY